jgi:hypothetical protein
MLIGSPKMSGLSISGTFYMIDIKSGNFPLYGIETSPERGDCPFNDES